jgi:hypothetical protein
MYLEKWYADMVEDGRVEIRYQANLHVGPVTIGYSGRLSEGRTSLTRIGMRRQPMPEIRGNAVHWPAGTGDPAIAWHGACSQPQQLWQNGNQAVSWDPIVLNGSVAVDGRHSLARGYVERLTLNLAPWRLGLKTLKWGRFCGRKHSLVWIDWIGGIPMKLSLLDGQTEWLEEVGQRQIRTEHARLALGKPTEIVSESLGSGALAALGWIRMFVVPRFLSGIETKWLAEASLELRGEAVDQGFTVYEEVVWQ